jgi:hypothetical protein
MQELLFIMGCKKLVFIVEFRNSFSAGSKGHGISYIFAGHGRVSLGSMALDKRIA